MSGFGASIFSSWCVRLLLAFSLLGLGGCWGGELARKDRDVRASWAALQAADSTALALASRLKSVWRRSADDRSAGDQFAELRRMNTSHRFDLGEPHEVARYGTARAQLLDHLMETAEMLGAPASAGLAWKRRGLRKACIATLLRSEGALRGYNEAAVSYNRALGASGRNVYKALLFPGRRQFALLSDE